MIIAGIILIGLAAAGELAGVVLVLMGKFHNPGGNKRWAISTISFVVFAVGGLIVSLIALG